MRSWKIRALLVGPAVGLCLLVSIHTAQAIELWSSVTGDRYYALDAALKWTSLLSHAPEDTALYPERWSAATLWRTRLAFAAQPTSWLNVETEHPGEIALLARELGSFLLTFAGGMSIFRKNLGPSAA